MPSLFTRKKSSTATAANSAAHSLSNSDTSESGGVRLPSTSPISPRSEQNASIETASLSPATAEKKKGSSYFSRERGSDKDKRPKSLRSSKSFHRSANSRKGSDDPDEHPLNLHPDDPRRLSALSAMSSPPAQENGGMGGESMETTPAPEAPGAFPQTNGVTNGEQHDGESGEGGEDGEAGAGPEVPPHRSPPPPQQEEKPKVDPEACKAAGNKLYKAGQYARAIDEYSKGKALIQVRR